MDRARFEDTRERREPKPAVDAAGDDARGSIPRAMAVNQKASSGAFARTAAAPSIARPSRR
jgi:hypothetical protein